MPEPTPTDQFGARIRERRRAAGLSQEALAHAANLHPNAVRLIERAEREPLLGTIVALATALGTTAAALLAGID